MDDFDILVEQQDQEMAEGGISYYTQWCLDEMAEGRPLPRLSDEALQRVTASFHRSLAQNDEDEDAYIYWDDSE